MRRRHSVEKRVVVRGDYKKKKKGRESTARYVATSMPAAAVQDNESWADDHPDR